MSAAPWIRWFAADYASKTRHLNLTEHGAYRALLDHYYLTRQPLPADLESLYRIASAMSDVEKKAVVRVSREFFENGDGVLRHDRCDEEIAEYQRWLEGKQRAANARWHKQSTSNADAGASAMHEQSTSPPPPPPPSPSTSTTPKAKASASSDSSLSAGIAIPLVGKRQWDVPKDFLAELEAAYPRVAGMATLREIRAWCVSNPTKCKTERGVRRFVNRWFEKVQNGR